MHPCRKLKITEADQGILDMIEKAGTISLMELLERLPSYNSQQLKKRLSQLKKHKYLNCDSNFKKIGVRTEN